MAIEQRACGYPGCNPENGQRVCKILADLIQISEATQVIPTTEWNDSVKKANSKAEQFHCPNAQNVAQQGARIHGELKSAGRLG